MKWRELRDTKDKASAVEAHCGKFRLWVHQISTHQADGDDRWFFTVFGGPSARAWLAGYRPVMVQTGAGTRNGNASARNL